MCACRQKPFQQRASLPRVGTGDWQAAEDFVKKFDFRPAAMIEQLQLRQPMYKQTTNYGHFGRAGLSWEA